MPDAGPSFTVVLSSRAGGGDSVPPTPIPGHLLIGGAPAGRASGRRAGARTGAGRRRTDPVRAERAECRSWLHDAAGAAATSCQRASTTAEVNAGMVGSTPPDGPSGGRP
ncbi:hypothetical protein SFR_2592 [Streptomyces sp. FR-008]|nr:hypothetical protein SFR_2592 [Streptomyces sp. FR-008]